MGLIPNFPIAPPGVGAPSIVSLPRRDYWTELDPIANVDCLELALEPHTQLNTTE